MTAVVVAICSCGEVFSKLGMPRPGSLRYRALCGHPFLYRATAIITLIRFHGPPQLENSPDHRSEIAKRS